MEFGARRAHGPESGVAAARAAYLAGCVSTSNLEAGRRWTIPVAGTMAHSWVLAHSDEVEAFKAFAGIYGERAVLLIDTYDTLAAVDRIVEAGLRPAAVRLDSGDLLTLARGVRERLDRAGLRETQIIGSGDLDERKIVDLMRSGAPFDGFGVGSSISAVTDLPSLSAVYKLVSIERDGGWRGVMKRSAGKGTLPGRKQVWRVVASGTAQQDVIGLYDEAPLENAYPLLLPVMQGGRRCAGVASLGEARERAAASLAEMPPDVKDIDGERRFPVHRSAALDALRRVSSR
jgi:nicotinate phosphoribosyltransferase